MRTADFSKVRKVSLSRFDIYSVCMRSVFLVFFLVPFALAVTTFADYPQKLAKECRVSGEKDGVVVGLDPVDDRKAEDQFFGANLAKKGFVAVFVVIENGPDSESRIFDTSKITYGAANSKLTIVKTGSITGKALALSAIPFAGGFIAAQETSDFLRIQHNVLEKEIRSTTISAGASARGFVYVPIPQEGKGREKMTLQIPIGKSGTDEVANFTLAF